MLNCHFIVFVCVFLTLIEGAHGLGLGGLGAEGIIVLNDHSLLGLSRVPIDLDVCWQTVFIVLSISGLLWYIRLLFPSQANLNHLGPIQSDRFGWS